MMIWSQPAASASSTPYWMMGLSTMGSISLGCALVAGRKRVPRPAAGKTALQTFIGIELISLDVKIVAAQKARPNFNPGGRFLIQPWPLKTVVTRNSHWRLQV